MFPFYSSCAYNKTKNRKRVENQSEINWKTFEVTVFSRGVPIPNQTFNFKFYLHDSHFFSSCVDKIHICFQVVLARLPFVFKLS